MGSGRRIYQCILVEKLNFENLVFAIFVNSKVPKMVSEFDLELF